MREVTRLYFDCMRRKEGHGCTHRQIQALIGPYAGLVVFRVL